MEQRLVQVTPFKLVCFHPKQALGTNSKLTPWACRDVYNSPKISHLANTKKWIKIDGNPGYRYAPFGKQAGNIFGEEVNVVFASRSLLIVAYVPAPSLMHFEDSMIEVIHKDFPFLQLTFNAHGEITSLTNDLEGINISRIRGLTMLAYILKEAKNLQLVKELIRILKLPQKISSRNDLLSEALDDAARIIVQRDKKPELRLFP